MYLFVEGGLPQPRQNSSWANNFISIFVHMLSFECCAIMRTFECRGSLLYIVADKLLI